MYGIFQIEQKNNTHLGSTVGEGTIGYYMRIGSFCGRTSVHVPKR